MVPTECRMKKDRALMLYGDYASPLVDRRIWLCLCSHPKWCSLLLGMGRHGTPPSASAWRPKQMMANGNRFRHIRTRDGCRLGAHASAPCQQCNKEIISSSWTGRIALPSTTTAYSHATKVPFNKIRQRKANYSSKWICANVGQRMGNGIQ